ncbi:hypothetical protein UA08_08038 [Talaromyces atroroseus]|uniref:Zn(2)-C6 fungal-type domain-containing protein n=1 Tax=Talaromyces atroroseus TaxID=1441469 RepID=A0A225AF94_TALAT|nr:hypothetical protein UA08_08038 [Talaromyces atroroseus]OKL56724.1 hypothetical protein UA08_08038 [Talaromyces atroroseus]
MPESYQSLGNQDPATSSFCSEEVQPGHGLVLRAGNNDTLATPSSSSAVSQWRLEARSSQGTQEPLLSVVAAARHFSATNSFENGYTASTTREDTTLPQEPLMLNWDLRRDRYSIIPPRTKTKRRKLTSFEKDRTKALKKAGGACDACRKVKKRCSHKDTLLGLNQTPTSSSSSSANNPRRRRQQISDARAVAIDKHTGSEWRHNSTNASSYQQLTAAGDPSVFTSSENNTPPSDATSIEYTSDINPARRSGTFALYAAGLGLQFK